MHCHFVLMDVSGSYRLLALSGDGISLSHQIYVERVLDNRQNADTFLTLLSIVDRTDPPLQRHRRIGSSVREDS